MSEGHQLLSSSDRHVHFWIETLQVGNTHTNFFVHIHLTLIMTLCTRQTCTPFIDFDITRYNLTGLITVMTNRRSVFSETVLLSQYSGLPCSVVEAQYSVSMIKLCGPLVVFFPSFFLSFLSMVLSVIHQHNDLPYSFINNYRSNYVRSNCYVGP